MRRLSGGFSLVALLCAGLLHTGTPGPAYAAPDEGERNVARPMSQTTATPPVTTGKGTKDGIQVDARANDRNRFERKSPAQKGTRKTKQHTGTAGRARDKRNPVGPVEHDDLRLDIGICGHRRGNSPGLIRCLPALDEPNEPDEPNQPEVTPSTAVVIRMPRPEDVQWEQVLAESKDVLFPRLRVKVQPAGRTLVNLDTIVYTDQSKVSTVTVELLGFPVVVEATPMSYTWNFGDGASVTTSTPGQPYPAKDITHKYMKKGRVGLTLTTHYAARFNVAGTGWQYVDGLVPITGPATALQVREAVPVLVEPGR
ncbi:PKD domain-containing protein [Kribbella catacumbae]|uniref:PKD domain-containing protein n=1 Tax=Kribbella catacumbae TaxID=460086 RepID=UPI00039B1F7E|nr:PKD domain-containing protein [Kribbella catacumbae]